MSCELCSFENPKDTVTAVIIKDNRVLLLARNEEPYKGWWDFPGGYARKGELLKEAMAREVKEELGVTIRGITLIKSIPGTAKWKERTFPIMNHAYLVDIHGDIALNKENTHYSWMPTAALLGTDIAFDSNKLLAEHLDRHFCFDLERIKKLIFQLDASAAFNEQKLYRAIINGHLETIYNGQGILVGMGWIFPRQTLLRKQAVIEDMIVDESQRGKGYGRKILKNLISWAKSQKCETIELTTNPKRIAANELYKSEGFKLHETNHYLFTLNN